MEDDDPERKKPKGVGGRKPGLAVRQQKWREDKGKTFLLIRSIASGATESSKVRPALPAVLFY